MIRRGWVCKEHGRVEPVMRPIPDLHNNMQGFKVPSCPVCGEMLPRPDVPVKEK